jgi:outer membrane protein assembly factor BamB
MNAATLDRRTFLAGSTALVLSALRAADPPGADSPWPQANGPFGNFNPRQWGAKLVDDLKDARKLWVSESNDLGRAKGSASGYTEMLADPTTHAGSASGLIVAEVKVFASSFRPRGDVWAEKQVRVAQDLGKFTGDRLAALKRNTALDADDLTVAIDLKTGKTAWRAVEEGKGLNRAGGKRLHFHLTPAYHSGRVFSMGTTGRVYCYDAGTGKKLWEDDTGSLVKPATALKEKLLKERNELPGGEGMGMSLVTAGGVLVVPQYGKPGQDVGLRGLHTETGKTLWEVPACTSRYATPAVWTHEDKQYLLVATIKGELRLIDPTNGKVLWTVSGLEPVYYPLSPSENHVFVNVKSEKENSKKPGQSWGRIGAYRITPEKAELAWKTPDKPEFWFENHMDICAMRRIQTRNGLVYLFTQGHTLDPKTSATHFNILDEKTGTPLFTTTDLKGSPQVFLVEDRMLYSPDAAHFKAIKWQFLTLDPKNFKPLGELWLAPHDNTTAYEVFIELPYVDGLLMMRTWKGQVVCYDLRKA